jgi:NAD(P)-dependent dehydrogenase (short-subunit alcohol dehydrogenase family)
MGNLLSQVFPPTPKFTEANLPNLTGKVYIVTGGYSGAGYELTSMLYRAGATVYIAGRSQVKATDAIEAITASVTGSEEGEQEEEEESEKKECVGQLKFLYVDLADLKTIAPAVRRFLRWETRLDVLYNNAGVSCPPVGSVSKQGHELQFATNALGPYLLTKLLSPILISTAKTAEPADVRVVFTTSGAAETTTTTTETSNDNDGTVTTRTNLALELSHLISPPENPQANYAASKLANWFLADHFSKSHLGPRGVLSIVQNPGNMMTPLLRHMPSWVPLVFAPFLYPPRFGAYTQLFAGLSPDLRQEDGGRWVQPWGRLHSSPKREILDAMKSREEGGTGLAAEVVAHCDRVTSDFS